MFSTQTNLIQFNTNDCFNSAQLNSIVFHVCSQNNQPGSVGRGNTVVAIPMFISKFQSKNNNNNNNNNNYKHNRMFFSYRSQNNQSRTVGRGNIAVTVPAICAVYTASVKVFPTPSLP